MQSGDRGGSGRPGGFSFGGSLALGAKIKIKTGGRGTPHALPRALAHRAVGQSGRNHQCLLRSANNDVDSIAIHVECHGSQPGDGIDHEQGVVPLLPDGAGDGGHVVARPGGALRSLHVNHANVRREMRLHLFDQESLSVPGFHHGGREPIGLGEGDPPLAKFSRREHQHLIAGGSKVGDRRFHGAGARRSHQDHIVLGAYKCLEIGQDFRIKGAEFRGAMMDISSRHGQLRAGQQRRGPGSEQPVFDQHPPIVVDGVIR